MPFTTLGFVRSPPRAISAASVAMSTAGSASGRSEARWRGVDRRQVALHVDDDVVTPFRIERRERLEDAVRARGVVGPRQHRPPPAASTASAISRESAATATGPIPASRRAARHARSSAAGDIGERLARKTRRRHARRDEDERVGHRAKRIHKGERAYGGVALAKCRAFCHCPERRGSVADLSPMAAATTKASLFRCQPYPKEAKQPRKHGAPPRQRSICVVRSQRIGAFA